MKKTVTFFTLFLLSPFLMAQDITEGLWFNEEKDAKIRFYEQDGKLFGKITWLKEPKENGKDRVDKHNPRPELRNKPLAGLVFLTGFEKDGKNWKNGEIYDPKSGKTYASSIKWAGDRQLNITRVYRGFTDREDHKVYPGGINCR
ncbi:MAG: DUF2147 domain-containing protein [Leadbetterella sp.]|nr:DUF2147 domain-containing protein [Leadbetterella sp.]